MKIVDTLQGLGRALMLPIAVLPVAGILLRLGQEDIAGPIQAVLPFLHLGFLAAAGGAIFDNLGLLFAIGAAVGFARDNHGAAGLAGVVSFLVATSGAKTLLFVPPSVTAGLSPHLADLAAAAQISVTDYLGGIDWKGHEQTARWYRGLKSRPSFRPLLSERMELVSPPSHYDNVDF